MPKIFPIKKEQLNAYLMSAVKHLNTHAVRLGINPAKLAELISLYGDNTTAGTYMFLYKLWADVGAGRTKNVIDDLLSLEKKLQKLLTEIYNDIPGSAWTNADRNAFNRKTGLPRAIPRRSAPIDESCFAMYKHKGGGDVSFEFRTSTDSSRPSLAAGANAVEIAWRIYKQIDYVSAETGKLELPGLRDPDDGTTKETHTKASFMLRFGTANSGSYLQFFARWINNHHPSLAAQWTGPFMLIIV